MIQLWFEPQDKESLALKYYYVNDNHPLTTAAHSHDEFEIIMVHDGSMKLSLNNEIYNAQKGDIIFINPETLHSTLTEKCTHECVVFSPKILALDATNCNFFINSIINHECSVNSHIHSDNKAMQTTVKELFDAAKNTTAGCKFLVIGALYKIFGMIVDQNLYTSESGVLVTTLDKNVHKIEKVLSYIHKNYSKKITLDDLAEIAGTSKKNLCHLFKKITEKTPVEYLNEFRITKAKSKLHNTDMCITDIAFACGFNDLSYFIKTFRSYNNISPTKFRKSQTEINKNF